MHKQCIRMMLDSIEDEQILKLIYHFLVALTK